ncbi:MAG TPA: PepSY-associated TM helix domain-containing protein [Rhizomicrobium sp.]|nr:PepSY-associated TM helix domain-containing protein [Rhizomicrobium sp.]
MKLRAVLFQIHLWTGLTLGIVLAVLGLSGAILVFQDELLEMGAQPAPRAVTPGVMLPLDMLAAAAREKAPAKNSSMTLLLPQEKGDALLVRFQPSPSPGPQGGMDVYVDPVSARVLDVRQTPYSSVVRTMHDLHGRLLVPGREGRQLVGWLGVAMLALGASGIVIWWPKRGQWRAAFRIRPNARGYWLYRDIHGAFGIWGLAAFLIVSFSGVAIAFPETVRSIVTLGAQQPAQPFDLRNGPPVEPVKGAKPLSLDGALRLAQAQMPDAQIQSITVQAKRNAAWRVTIGDPHDGLVAIAYVDPWQKKIAAMRNPSESRAGAFMAWQRPLHEGSGLGPLWRLLVFLSGLLPSLFVATGLVMWIKKRRARARIVPSAAAVGGNA